jgi:hypothetical protein
MGEQMKLVVLAFVLVASVGQAQSSGSAIEEGQRLSQDVMSSWKSCLVGATDRYGRSSEKAETIADVALNKCAEWDPAVKKAMSHMLAAKMIDQMPFDMALKVAEDDADNTLTEAKARMKLNLVERILDKRQIGKR